MYVAITPSYFPLMECPGLQLLDVAETEYFNWQLLLKIKKLLYINNQTVEMRSSVKVNCCFFRFKQSWKKTTSYDYDGRL